MKHYKHFGKHMYKQSNKTTFHPSNVISAYVHQTFETEACTTTPPPKKKWPIRMLYAIVGSFGI